MRHLITRCCGRSLLKGQQWLTVFYHWRRPWRQMKLWSIQYRLTSHVRLTRSRSGESHGENWKQTALPSPAHHLLTTIPLHFHGSEQNFLAEESCNREPVTSVPFHDPNQWLILLCSKPLPLFKPIFRFNSVFCNVVGADRQHTHK